jgi:hypothetical protein
MRIKATKLVVYGQNMHFLFQNFRRAFPTNLSSSSFSHVPLALKCKASEKKTKLL